ncbi:unnamed protein product [Peniophora sp. CBMAI 1063]|nr:unnamed protein product [Peniophora sp. CBMAI 1063]
MAPYGKPEVQFDHDSPITALHTIAEIHIFPLLVETGLIAIFTVQTTYFAYHRWTRKEPDAAFVYAHHRRIHVNALLCLAVFMYLLALAYWALDVVVAQQELLVFWPELLTATAGPDPYQSLTNRLGTTWYAQAVIQGFIWTASDAVALWRAYVVHREARWLGIAIPLLLLTEFGVYAGYLVFYTHILPTPPEVVRRKSMSSIIVVAPYLAAASITVTVQVFATTLIAYKAWTLWKERKDLFTGSGRLVRTLAVWIESGMMYTLLWIWYILATNDSVFSWEMTAWTEYYSIPLMAMYPSLVVMVVTMQNSALTMDNLPCMNEMCSDIVILKKNENRVAQIFFHGARALAAVRHVTRSLS